MELLDQIETYLAQTRIPPSKFGRMVLGDPRFVEDLRAGRRPRATTLDRVRAYLVKRHADDGVRNNAVQMLIERGSLVPEEAVRPLETETGAEAQLVQDVALDHLVPSESAG